MATLNLQDTYFHISIREWYKTFLWFTSGTNNCHSRVLSFGIASVPRVFIKTMLVIATHLWTQGVTVFPYIDDWLLVAGSRDLLLRHLHLTIILFQFLGIEVMLHSVPESSVYWSGYRHNCLSSPSALDHASDSYQSYMACSIVFRSEGPGPYRCSCSSSDQGNGYEWGSINEAAAILFPVSVQCYCRCPIQMDLCPLKYCCHVPSGNPWTTSLSRLCSTLHHRASTRW